MNRQSEGRNHIGRQSTLSESVGGTGSFGGARSRAFDEDEMEAAAVDSEQLNGDPYDDLGDLGNASQFAPDYPDTARSDQWRSRNYADSARYEEPRSTRSRYGESRYNRRSSDQREANRRRVSAYEDWRDLETQEDRRPAERDSYRGSSREPYQSSYPARHSSSYQDSYQDYQGSYRENSTRDRYASESYRDETQPSRRSSRYSTRTNDSVWAESRNARTRRAARQGTAHDARRTMQQHETRSHRTPNRNTVYNTGGSQEESEMFQAVAAGDHAGPTAHYGRNGALGGINTHGSWHSSNGMSHPALREHHRSNLLSIALPVVIVILLIIAIALGVHSCVAG